MAEPLVITASGLFAALGGTAALTGGVTWLANRWAKRQDEKRQDSLADAGDAKAILERELCKCEEILKRQTDELKEMSERLDTVAVKSFELEKALITKNFEIKSANQSLERIKKLADDKDELIRKLQNRQ